MHRHDLKGRENRIVGFEEESSGGQPSRLLGWDVWSLNCRF